MDPGSVRILVVDDSETTRRALHAIVRLRDWTICGEAENGRSGVEQFQKLKPDVVILDLAMPDIDGIEAARLMSAHDPTVPLILFTMLDVEGIEGVAQAAGIKAIVPKTKAWNLIGNVEELVRPEAAH